MLPAGRSGCSGIAPSSACPAAGISRNGGCGGCAGQGRCHKAPQAPPGVRVGLSAVPQAGMVGRDHIPSDLYSQTAAARPSPDASRTEPFLQAQFDGDVGFCAVNPPGRQLCSAGAQGAASGCSSLLWQEHPDLSLPSIPRQLGSGASCSHRRFLSQPSEQV